MADLDGMTIIADSATRSAGGAFVLAKSPAKDVYVEMDDGWSVEARAGSIRVLARGGPLRTYERAWENSFDAVQRGLDLLSLKDIADLQVVNAEDRHDTWWIEKEGVVLRTVDSYTFGFTLSGQGTVRDKDGNERVDPPRPPSRWDPSMRYFRLSQLTDDLVEAYRNRWLALESLLDTIEPIGKQQGENDWVKAALTKADGMIGLQQYLPSGGGSNSVKRARKYFYDSQRKFIFHAKPSRQPLLPRESRTRNSLNEALRRLTDLYLALLERTVGIRYPSSSVSNEGARHATDVVKDFELHATDDLRPFRDGLADYDMTGVRFVHLPTKHEQQPAPTFARTIQGSELVGRLSELPHVGRIVGKAGGEVKCWFGGEGRLTLNGVSRYEAQLKVQMSTIRRAKIRFAS